MCNTPLEEKQIKQDCWVKEELIVVEDVSIGLRPQCGEKGV
jgi:hypothetical protein